ncbi:hypothetical protein SDC9_185239 [bioreactor metagenome]|uniref:Uncharacterized protein n=1 Tax=bioreactor metagenome TaxID=1076179 RepID=A0A645HHQ1_9ZZZZ
MNGDSCPAVYCLHFMNPAVLRQNASGLSGLQDNVGDHFHLGVIHPGTVVNPHIFFFIDIVDESAYDPPCSVVMDGVFHARIPDKSPHGKRLIRAEVDLDIVGIDGLPL